MVLIAAVFAAGCTAADDVPSDVGVEVGQDPVFVWQGEPTSDRQMGPLGDCLSFPPRLRSSSTFGPEVGAAMSCVAGMVQWGDDMTVEFTPKGASSGMFRTPWETPDVLVERFHPLEHRPDLCGRVFWSGVWSVVDGADELYTSNLVPWLGDGRVATGLWRTFGRSALWSDVPISGHGCLLPGFARSGSDDVKVRLTFRMFTEPDLVDVLDVAEGSAYPTVRECRSGRVDDRLPISMCSSGLSVLLFEEEFGARYPDGFFDSELRDALLVFQTSAGLEPSGEIDAATWSLLGVTAGSRFEDVSGDGVVDASEFT